MLRDIEMLSGLRGQSPRYEKRELTTEVKKKYVDSTPNGLSRIGGVTALICAGMYFVHKERPRNLLILFIPPLPNKFRQAVSSLLV